VLSNPGTGNTNVNGRYLDLSAIRIPGFGTSGPYQSPFYVRSPTTNNFDLTVFKNFAIREGMKIQFRAAFFNIFNSAFPNTDQGDIDTRLITVCNTQFDPAANTTQYPNGVPNGTGFTTQAFCDPRGGFSFDAQTISTFGRVVSKRGHRRVEFAFKFYF
jgi:hypothetical protein